MGFGYFTDWWYIKVVVYSVVRHIVGCFSYGSEGFLLAALDAVDNGYFCRAP